MEKATVYFTKKIDSSSLIAIYKALGRNLEGKVSVKVSTGEPGVQYHLDPPLIGDLTHLVTGTFVECCTAYEGRFLDADDNWKIMKDHGFTVIAPCDIMDEMGDRELFVDDGLHLKTHIVGNHFMGYDSMLVLSNFKPHRVGGFGGALKAMSLGLASPRGKVNIHSAGTSMDSQDKLAYQKDQDAFLESMADACKSVMHFMGKDHILYISVASNLSADKSGTSDMADIGVFASTDPVAIDQACYDAVVNSSDPGKKAFVDMMESLHAIHVVEAAAQLGLGSREYELVSID